MPSRERIEGFFVLLRMTRTFCHPDDGEGSLFSVRLFASRSFRTTLENKFLYGNLFSKSQYCSKKGQYWSCIMDFAVL